MQIWQKVVRMMCQRNMRPWKSEVQRYGKNCTSVQEGNLKIEELGNRAIWKSETYLNYERYKFGFFSVNIYMSAAVVLHVSSTETGPTALPCITCAREDAQLPCMISSSPSLPHSRKYLEDKQIEKRTIRNSPYSTLIHF